MTNDDDLLREIRDQLYLANRISFLTIMTGPGSSITDPDGAQEFVNGIVKDLGL